MYICEKCETEIPEEYKFCGMCGEKIPEETITAKNIFLTYYSPTYHY